MAKQLERNYVWECDYGDRSNLVPVLETLLDEQDASSLKMVNVMVNHNIYNLELFIVLSYDNPIEDHIINMKELFLDTGVRYRPDITYDELFKEIAHRRFNCMTLIDSELVELRFNSFFEYKEKKEVYKTHLKL